MRGEKKACWNAARDCAGTLSAIRAQHVCATGLVSGGLRVSDRVQGPKGATGGRRRESGKIFFFIPPQKNLHCAVTAGAETLSSGHLLLLPLPPRPSEVHAFQPAPLRRPRLAPGAPAAGAVQAQDERAARARLAEGADVAAGSVGGAGVLLQVDGQQEGGGALAALVRPVDLVAAVHVRQDAACRERREGTRRGQDRTGVSRQQRKILYEQQRCSLVVGRWGRGVRGWGGCHCIGIHSVVRVQHSELGPKTTNTIKVK